MKKMKKTAVLLMAAVMALAMTAGTAFAESTQIDGKATFDGSDIESSLDGDELVKAFEDLQPGDDITVRVEYENEYGKATDWYMANEVVQTLEKANGAKKVEGTGDAENGGYTYSLVHTDKNGKDTVLFSNDEVGGDAKPNDMEGLEQATNALDEWFFLQTLKQNETGLLTLKVKFDGETEVNDYMDTDGEVLMRFAVELTKSPNPDKDKHEQKNGTKTGDLFPLWLLFLIMIAAGIALLALLLRKRRKEEGGEA